MYQPERLYFNEKNRNFGKLKKMAQVLYIIFMCKQVHFAQDTFPDTEIYTQITVLYANRREFGGERHEIKQS